MRIQSLLLILASASQAVALRGEKRGLQGPPPPPGAKDPKEGGPKEAGPKEAGPPPPKDPKAPKDGCKKADPKLVARRDRKLAGRYLQVPPPPPPPPALPEEIPYCLHGEFTDAQCADLRQLPKDKKVSTAVRMELVHNDEQSGTEIVRNMEAILEDDTNSRFVGCRDMKAPPPPHSPQRFLILGLNGGAADEPTNESTNVPTNDMFVTGVDFKSLDIVRDECKDSTVQAGQTCDVIESKADIFYESTTEPTFEDKKQMEDLLLETLLSQKAAGSFEPVGTVDSVQIQEGSGNSWYGPDGYSSSGSGEDSGLPVGAIAGALVAAVAVFGLAYWYGTSGKDEEPTGKEKHNETSDDSDNDGGWFGGAARKKEDKADEAKAVQEKKQEGGGWFASNKKEEYA